MEVTVNLNTIPGESSLVDQGLKDRLTGIFGRMEKKVTIRAATDLSRKKDRGMTSFLRAVIPVNPSLELELYRPSEADQVSELNTVWLSVTGLYKDGAYGHAAFHGVPGGREINFFVLAVYDLTGPGQEVSKSTRRKMEQLDKKANIRICVSLACYHCLLVMTVCQQIAILNPNIKAEVVDTALYDGLVAQCDIKRVPMTIVNDNRIVMGSRTMDEIVTLLK